jgi:twinkle protein
VQLIDDKTDFTAYLAEPEALVKVRHASSYTDDVIAYFNRPDEMRGIYLPWEKTRRQFRLRRNELTLWPGINGHGKSLVLNQVMLHAMTQGEKVLICSMEMPPVKTMERMVKQATGTAAPSTESIREFSAWSNNRLWIYDHLGSVQWRKLLAVLRFAAKEIGITQIVVDSMMRCGVGETDYDSQKAFIDALCTFRSDYAVAVHLVMHARKREDEFALPGKFDAKGSGTITDLADNVVTTWRNKKKEAAIAQSHYQRSRADVATLEQPDAMLIVDKNRHGTWEGKIALWFLGDSGQFVETSTSPATSMEFSK